MAKKAKIWKIKKYMVNSAIYVVITSAPWEEYENCGQIRISQARKHGYANFQLNSLKRFRIMTYLKKLNLTFNTLYL